MRSLSSIADSWTWYILCVCALVLFVGAFAFLFRSIKDKRKKLPCLISLFNLLLIACLNVILLDCGHALRPTTTHYYSQLQRAMFDAPYFAYILIEMFSCIAMLVSGFENSKYRSGNITDDSVQQTLDALPEGIAVYGNDGVVRLSNLKINDLSRAMTGKVLTDANKFWAFVKKKGKEQSGKYLLRSTSDKMWLFEKEDMTVNDEQYSQIIATDVTERYTIIEELEKKNEHPELNMVLHTDQGSVYSSKEFNELLPLYNITRSMSRAGTPTDNAAMESINGWVKTELFTDFHITSNDDVPKQVDDYIRFFNEERPAYTLGYLTPKQYREQFSLKH